MIGKLAWHSTEMPPISGKPPPGGASMPASTVHSNSPLTVWKSTLISEAAGFVECWSCNWRHVLATPQGASPRLSTCTLALMEPSPVRKLRETLTMVRTIELRLDHLEALSAIWQHCAGLAGEILRPRVQ